MSDGAIPVWDAATVVLLRDGQAADGTPRPEAWLLTRVTRMAFAGGMTVFPGGRVDEPDARLPWAGCSPEVFAAAMHCDVELARALVGAAVRETFEEAGVLLCAPSAELAHLQPDVESGRLSFGELLAAHGLAIDADRLRPWSRWVTPEREQNRRRYDTRFFVAAIPAGAKAQDLTSESSVAGWRSVADALAENERKERRMMPPTLATLRSISGYDTVAEVLAAAADRSLDAINPRMTDDQTVTLPDGSVLPVPD